MMATPGNAPAPAAPAPAAPGGNTIAQTYNVAGGGTKVGGQTQNAAGQATHTSRACRYKSSICKYASQLGQMQRSNVSGNRRDQSAMAYQPQVSGNDLSYSHSQPAFEDLRKAASRHLPA